MKRFDSISFYPSEMKIVEYEIPQEQSGEYCVDTSHFVPRCEAEAVFMSAGDLKGQGAYDFADGKDTGARVPYTRSAAYSGDIAELSNAVAYQQQEAKSNLDKSKLQFEREQILSGNSGDSSADSGPASSN